MTELTVVVDQIDADELHRQLVAHVTIVGSPEAQLDRDQAADVLRRAFAMDAALRMIAGLRLNGEPCPDGCRGALCGRDGDESIHDIGSSDAEYDLLFDCVEQARAARRGR